MTAAGPSDLLEIDPTPIDEFLEAFGIDDAREAVVRLADGIERKLSDIRAGLARSSVAAIGQSAHDLASLAGSVGLIALEAAARAIESACEAGDGASAIARTRALGAIDDRVPFVVANAFVDAVRARLPRPGKPSGPHWGGAA